MLMADTATVPDDGGTFGSMSTPRTVPAVRQGAAAARNLLAEFAAQQWKVVRDTATPNARASSVSAGKGSELGTSSLSEGSVQSPRVFHERRCLHAPNHWRRCLYDVRAADPHHHVLSVSILPPLTPRGMPEQLNNTTITQWWWLIGPFLTIVGTLVGALLLRWVLHRAIDRIVDRAVARAAAHDSQTPHRASRVLSHASQTPHRA